MERVRILVGTETGNAEDVASELAVTLEGVGFETETLDMEDAEPEVFLEERAVVVCTSTFGDGELPFNSEALYEALGDERPDLGGLLFAVCALGDSAYPDFCAAGGIWSDLLSELGATEVIERYEVDEAEDEEVEGACEWVERAGTGFTAAVG